MTTSESTSPSPRPRHRRWLLSALLLLALLVGMVIWLTHPSTRRPFIGEIDPTTGYHFRFTVASGWPQAEDPISAKKYLIHSTGMGYVIGPLDSLSFTLPKPNPFQAWVDKQILHRIPLPPASRVLYITSGNSYCFRLFQLQGDYPTFTSTLHYPMHEERHLHISGQPATWFALTWNRPNRPTVPGAPGASINRLYLYDLVVKVKDKDLWFSVSGVADEAHRQQIQNEVR
ncbi:MAG TPA: hypothetical protein VKU00_16840, partial [Chthonomonadaceae bacterium]|nr:hypothetical protein [Chthonomonadaceae bacterium]